MNAKKYHFIHILALAMLVLMFVASITISHISLRGIQFDLTEKKLWTLTQGSQNILSKLNEPIMMTFFLSRRLAQNYPAIRSFSQRVRGLLKEMEKHSKGKIKIQYIDPEAFSESEDRALSFGLRPVAVVKDQPLYFGLVAENLRTGVETVPAFTIKRQHQLEYNLIQMVRSLSINAKPVLGIITSLPLDTGIEGLGAALKGRARPFLIYQQLFANFKLEFLEQNIKQIPSQVKVLMVAHPKKLNVKTLYAIDQFVLQGGKMILLIDPYCEISQLTNSQGKKLKGLGLTSNLEPLLRNWGVAYEPRDIVADRSLAQTVALADPLRKNSIERQYVLWLNLRQNNIAQDEAMTKGLFSINFGTSGHFSPRIDGNENKRMTFKPLITSSKDSMLFSTKYIKTPRTPDDLLAQFRSSEIEYVLAAKISGNFKSAFDKAPKRKRNPNRITTKSVPVHIASSKKPTDIVLIADSDLLEKRFWIDMATYYRQNTIVPIADNATFIINAIDELMGNDDLIALRTRSPQTRSFTQVDELRRLASQQLAAEEYHLRAKIQKIEARLAKFGKSPEKIKAGQEQLWNLERELLASRRSLQQVRRALNQDIEILGAWVRFFNIIFVPLVLVILVLLYPLIKTRLNKKTKLNVNANV